MNAKTVFISYSHDSPQHSEQVLALSERLRDDAVEPAHSKALRAGCGRGGLSIHQHKLVTSHA